MANQLCLLFVALIISVISLSSIRAESLLMLSQQIPILAKPYNKSAFIDVRDDKKPNILFQKKTEPKSLSDFGAFLRDTENAYAGIWAFRVAYIRQKDQLIIDPVKWWKNITHFQNHERRGSITWNDGDAFITNWVKHPVFGASVYLYYRARGYNRSASAFGAFLQSTLFEYAVEGIDRPPSLHDLVVTPAAGIPLGIILEGASNWLENRQSGFLRAASYIINPSKIFFRGDNKVNLGPIRSQYITNWV
ncbi:MAG: hypothetical protein C4291_14550 [Candidatus Dadabacteria bacterium]